MEDHGRKIYRAFNTLGSRTDLRLSMLIMAQDSGHFLTGNQIMDRLQTAGSSTLNLNGFAADIARIIAPSGLLLKKSVVTGSGVAEAFTISSDGMENGVPLAAALCGWELKYPNLSLREILGAELEPSVKIKIYKEILDCGEGGIPLPNYQQLLASFTGRNALSNLIGVEYDASSEPTERKLYLLKAGTKPLNVRAEVKAADTIARELINQSITHIYGEDLLEAIKSRYPHFNNPNVWKKILESMSIGKLLVVENAPLNEYKREQIRITISNDYLRPITALIDTLDQLINNEEYRQRAIRIGKNLVKNNTKFKQLLNGI